jgi:hypothetical protein
MFKSGYCFASLARKAQKTAGYSITDAAAAIIGEALKVNTTIASLLLIENQIDEKGAGILGNALADNKSITGLGLISKHLGVGGITNIFTPLKNNKTITHLYLGHKDITKKEEATVIAAVLRVNETITDLKLFMKINDKLEEVNNWAAAPHQQIVWGKLDENDKVNYLLGVNRKISKATERHQKDNLIRTKAENSNFVSSLSTNCGFFINKNLHNFPQYQLQKLPKDVVERVGIKVEYQGVKEKAGEEKQKLPRLS